MAREDTSRRGRYGRGNRGGRQNQDWQNRPSNEGNWQQDYSYSGSRREFESESGFDRPGANEPYRPSWPEQRGSFGEREYGQGEQSQGGPRGYEWRSQGDPGQQRDYGQQAGYSQPRGYGQPGGMTPQQQRAWRESVYSWPHESMGMGTNMVPYGGSQYGSAPYGGSYPQPWGGQVGFGAYVPGVSPYERHTFVPEYPEGAWGSGQTGPGWQGGGPQHASYTPPQYGQMHDYGHESHAGRGPKGYKRTDDRIHEEICERLTRDPWIDAREIEVKVKHGEVKLSGKVHERRLKHMVEDAVASVSGVTEINNEIKIEHDHPGFKGEIMGAGRPSNGREFEEDEEEEARSSRNRSNATKL